MVRTTYKLFVVAVAATMLGALSGCGTAGLDESEDPYAVSTDGTVQTETDEAGDAAAAESAEPPKTDGYHEE